MTESKPRENDALIIYPWTVSATRQWGPDSGLTELRDYAHGEITADEMVEWLWEPGAFVQNGAVKELLAHGHPRQAAVFVRALVAAHPVCKESLKNDFGNMVDTFLTTPLEQYPSQPNEYPPNMRISYMQ